MDDLLCVGVVDGPGDRLDHACRFPRRPVSRPGQTQLAWQVCGVLSAGVLLSMWWAYRKIYTDPAPPPVETEVDDEEERPPDSPGLRKG
jgi:hypothetical protein